MSSTAESAQTPAIAIVNLSKNYNGTPAVVDLSLEIHKGEFFGLLGPNGAGKTTTIGAISGIVQPTSGEIFVEGLDAVGEYQEVHRRIGVSFQEIILDSRFLNVEEILVYQAGYYGIPAREARPRVIELLEQFELIGKRKALAHQLSGGQKRRLALAKSLIHDPDILILDEPTAGADVQLRHRLWNSLRGLQQDRKTVLLTTHYLEEAEALCDRIAIINHGKLIALDTPKALMAETKKSRLEDVFLTLVEEEGRGTRT